MTPGKTFPEVVLTASHEREVCMLPETQLPVTRPFLQTTISSAAGKRTCRLCRCPLNGIHSAEHRLSDAVIALAFRFHSNRS
jgi:hypothetical protein